MENFKVHIIHVGNMANKGTQALLISDVYVIREVLGGRVSISVSTTDVEGVKRLKLPLNKVTSPLIDIPYEKADFYAKKFGFSRKSFKYKILAVASLYSMFIQVFLSIFSIFLLKMGLKPLYKADWLRCMKECDLVVSYSDENFKEMASQLPLNVYWIIAWWSMLISRTWEIFAARLLGKPVVLFPNSVGPFRTFIGLFLAKTALNNCHVILLREPISYEIVKSLGVKAPKILTTDTSIVLSDFMKGDRDEKMNLTIGVSPGVYGFSLPKKMIRGYVLAHAKALDYVIERYGFSIVFLPHYVSGLGLDDLEISRLIVGNMKYKSQASIVNVSSVKDFKRLIARMEFIISSKMHPAVIAASVYVPFLFIAYDHKQYGFAASLGLEECVLSVEEVSADKLLVKIDYVYKNLEQIRSLLRERVPNLQRHVKESIHLAIAPFYYTSVR